MYYEMMYIKRLIRDLNSLCCLERSLGFLVEEERIAVQMRLISVLWGEKWMDVRRELFDVCPFVRFHIGINGCTICAKNMKIKFKKDKRIRIIIFLLF